MVRRPPTPTFRLCLSTVDLGDARPGDRSLSVVIGGFTCQIVRTGQRIVYRLLSWNRWLSVMQVDRAVPGVVSLVPDRYTVCRLARGFSHENHTRGVQLCIG